MSFFHCYEIPLSCLESSSRTARGYPGCQGLFLRDYLVDVCYCRPARKAYLALCLSCDSSTPRGRTKSSGTQGGSLMRLSHVQPWKALLYRCVHCIPCGDVWTWCLITRSTGVHFSWPNFILRISICRRMSENGPSLSSLACVAGAEEGRGGGISPHPPPSEPAA